MISNLRRKYKPVMLILSLMMAGCDAGNADEHQSLTAQQIIRKGTVESFKGSSENFTGKVMVSPLLGPNVTTPLAEGALVTFEPEARTHWHTHPAGQIILIVDGVGYTQSEGSAIEEVGIGDTIVCPPNVKHWHGASPDSYMTHFVITGKKNGKNVQWMEAVTDEQYYALKPLK